MMKKSVKLVPALTQLTPGRTILQNGSCGTIVELYNDDCLGVFHDDNGAVFTVDSNDLKSEQPPLSPDEVVAEIYRIFNKPVPSGLVWS